MKQPAAPVKSRTGKTKPRAKALPLPNAPTRRAPAAPGEAANEAPPVPEACEALVELCLKDGVFDERTRGYKKEPFDAIAAEYAKLQNGSAHLDALSELVGLSGYFQNLGYTHGAEQLKTLALTSAPILEQRRRAGWNR